MKIKPGDNNIRTVDGDTPYGEFEYVAFESFTNGKIIADGRQVGTASMQIRSPDEQPLPGAETADTARRRTEARKPALQRDAASAATVAERKAVCEACEQYDFGHCEKAPGCGGGGSLWLTVRRAGAKCPEERWSPVKGGDE